MTNWKTLCAALVDEAPYESPTTCLARAALAQSEPPSLKEQALEELEQLKGDANSMGMGFDAPAIRRALEALPND
jgi:hypothetical protein